MAFLEQFSDQEKELLVSLPYKAGLWVSMADNAGGESADVKEKEALELIIDEKGKGMFESAFVHEVMSETCTRKQEWPKWEAEVETVLQDLDNAVTLIKAKLQEKDCDAYASNIMAIGVKIAEAFREFDADASVMVKIDTQIRLFLEAMTRIIKRDKSLKTETALNISYEEDRALSELYKALYKDAA